MAQYTINAELTAEKFKIQNVADGDKKKFLQADGSLGEVNVTYSNNNETPQKVGGIEAGTTFKDKTVTEMFNMLLYPYQYPTASLTLTPNTTFEKGVSTSIKAVVSGTAGTNSIDSSGYYVGVDSSATFSATTAITKSISNTTTFYAKVKDSEGKESSLVSKQITAGYRFFFGTSSSNSFSANQLDNAALKTNVPKGEYTITGDSTKKYVFLVYPSSWSITVQNMGATFNDYTSQTSISRSSGTYTVLKFNPEYKAGSTTFKIV